MHVIVLCMVCMACVNCYQSVNKYKFLLLTLIKILSNVFMYRIKECSVHISHTFL